MLPADSSATDTTGDSEVSEQVTAETRFKDEPMLYIDDEYVAEVAKDRNGVYVDSMHLDIEQARALRDWLNKALP